jgi:hypothetical protein
MTKERPILFSGEMVRAILDGTKTMTRRICKHPPTESTFDSEGMAMFADEGGELLYGPTYADWFSPYSGVERLWVKETFAPMDYGNAPSKIQLIEYKAGCAVEAKNYPERPVGFEPGKIHTWKPSIFLPRWASRITLEVKEVRVERLNEITVEDARREGCTKIQCNCGDCIDSTEIGTFQDLWDSINGKRGYGWSENNWVWVISFRRIQP